MRMLAARFSEILEPLSCQGETKAYIASIFGKFGGTDFDMSKDSIVLSFWQAGERKDFAKFQSLGDWLFFARALFPASLSAASPDFYETVARISFYRCFRMVHWQCYEELADEFIPLTEECSILLSPTAPSPTCSILLLSD